MANASNYKKVFKMRYKTEVARHQLTINHILTNEGREGWIPMFITPYKEKVTHDGINYEEVQYFLITFQNLN
jgi:hypothetical protein